MYRKTKCINKTTNKRTYLSVANKFKKKKPEKKTLQLMTLVGDVCQIWLVSRWQIVYVNRCDLPTLVSEWIFDSGEFNLNSRYMDVGMDHE